MVLRSDSELPEAEKLVRVPDAVEAATGYRPTPSTAWRWTKKGVRGIRLKTVDLGGRPVSCERWAREFVEATTAARDGA
ncbi:DUF1580 domain-containing protein [Botrimarina sp.]|uniref:DUF1580 domain-containing protein n=1 Tax=Botrimarina sp. TaxID=2795802 RepID=UPI0032ED0F24